MNLIQRIDALLPQTQCGKCGHPGCKPYATGIASGEPINKCPPGGQETLAALAQLLEVPLIELDTSRGSAPAQVAYIREAECIGCTKCIQACPVDAIVGAAKLMHTVIVEECTGCDLCVAPCPVDCIEMRPLPSSNVVPIIGGLAFTSDEQQARAAKRDHARQRFEQRNARLKREEEQKQAERLSRAQRSAPTQEPARNPVQAAIERVKAQNAAAADAALKQAKIAVAMSRAQLNKSMKAFGSPPTAEQHRRLQALLHEFEQAEQQLARLQALEIPAENTPPPASGDALADLKRAKIQLALRRAELSKLERDPATTPETLQEARQRLTEAQCQVDAHAVP
ncbi:electron transport complex subunit RsxB [Pseudomonas sp. LS1212]|uniref:electron transport complex subunit RsxB n=1 Tax=Pseudomonas sp. LS1212 TaxID=2972478 RepID=UPI00215CC7C1|nr:electron transport complex subunit RsxB [Pseudomonas sp. LS1212]UVJ43032.1 electron transport complex subunit RsxB [Pseudomonas sp. LS1212]